MTTKEELMTVINKSFEEQKKRPGVVALEGTWGCGKSYLLNEVLNEWINPTPADPFRVVVTYNAWEDDSGEKPIVPVLLKLAQELDQIVVGDDGSGRDVSSFFDAAIECLGFIPGWGDYVDRFQRVKGHVKKWLWKKPKEKASSSDVFKGARAWSDLYKKLGSIMDSASASQYKVILVIDDLDRVLPTRQIDLLESLYHLSQSMRVLILVAYDSKQLERSIDNYFGKETTVSGYTQKIFSCTLRYETPEVSALWKDMAQTLGGNQQSPTDLDENDLVNLFSGFSISNRDLKKIDIALKAFFATPGFTISGPENKISLVLFIANLLHILPPSAEVKEALGARIKRFIYSHNSNAVYYEGKVEAEIQSVLMGYEVGRSKEWQSILRVCMFEGLDSHIEVERPEIRALADEVGVGANRG